MAGLRPPVGRAAPLDLMLAIVTSHPIQYQATLWRALADAGVAFEVWFLTPHAVKPTFDREFGRSFAWDVDLLSGYPHRFLAIEENWDLKRFRGIRLRRSWRDEFRAAGVTDVWIEGWRFKAFWDAARAARAAGMRVWLRGENHALAPESWKVRIGKRPLLRWLFGHIDHFLYIGQANRRFYQSYGVDPSRLHPAPYCVDNDFFARSASALRPERNSLRRGWGIQAGAWCALFCGKLIPKKRPLDLVRAAQHLPPEIRAKIHLLFVGDGELMADLKAALAEPSAPSATSAGFLNQSEVPRAFVAADCLVLPSDFGETWGLVANEALASDLPIIVSDRCGCGADLAAPLGSDHIFPCGDLSALANAMTSVMKHPPPAAVLRRIVESHSPKRTASTVSALMERFAHP